MLKKTELYIESSQLDLYGDESFILNFNVADITDITAKASSYSKEVDIPATKQNNKIFSHLFDVNSEGYFNPLSKKTAELFIDGVCVMKGYFKLNGMTIIDNEYVTYHGVIYEDSINFIQALGELELSNLVLPLTGTTASVTGSTGTVYIDTFTGTDYVFSPPITTGTGGSITLVPARRTYNLDAQNLIITGGVFASLQPVSKNCPTWPWFGTYAENSNDYINAFVALQDVVVNLTAHLTFTTARALIWQWFKTTPSGSTAIHTGLTSGGSGAPVTSITLASGTVNLATGEGLYIRVRDAGPLPYTGSTAPLPIPVASSSYIDGTIAATSTAPIDNLLIDESYILNNIFVATGSTNSDICFPLVDYNQTFPYSATNKKSSTYKEWERPGVRVKFEDLRPAVFVKKVWDAIFKQAGFKYKSKFLDTNMDMFNKLIVIGGMEEEEVQSLQYESLLTPTSTGTYYTLTEPIQDEETGSPTSTGYIYNYKTFLLGGALGTGGGTPSSYWKQNLVRPSYTEKLLQTYTDANRTNPQHGFSGLEYGNVLKALVAGKYKIQAQIDGTSLAVLKAGSAAPVGVQQLIYRLKIETIKGGSFNNDPTSFTAPSKAQWTEKKVITFKREPTVDPQDFILNLDETIEMEQGDLARVVLYASAEAQFDPTNTTASPYTSVTQLNNYDATTGKGCYVRYYRCGSWVGYRATSLTNMLPRGMKQSDFIIGLAKMFNLYFEPDKQDPKTIYIEPRDVYYEDGRVLNWEKKMDYTKAFDISILPHDQAKNFIFKYMDDNADYYTEQYKKFTTNGLTFGSYKFISPDEYVTDTNTLELPFAASYLQKISGTDPYYNVTGTTAQPMVITKIINPDSQKPGYEGKASSWKVEPRILYYGGAINLPLDIYRNYEFYLTSNEPDGDVYEIYMPCYPYAGHYDKPLEPTLDINFFTDTHYCPTTYWNNISGDTTSTTSTTIVNMSTLTIGGSRNIVIVPPAYFNYSTFVDKYIKVTNISSGSLGEYFIGKVTYFSGGLVTLKITEIYGTGTFSSWSVKLQNVVLKNDLYNIFYKQQMIELTDQSARLMTANFYLTPVDIANFRFNDIVYAHKEYWRVNKIIDFDTSSDVKQTTKVELIKILRAETNTLIDYTAGGYLGLAGGTGGGTTTTGIISGTGTSPTTVGMRPAGTPGLYTRTALSSMMLVNNSIVQNSDSQVPTFFNKEVTVYTGTQSLKDTVVSQGNDINIVREIAINTPIGDTITINNTDSSPIMLGNTIRQVYFNTDDRTKLFGISLPDVTTDGYTINFNALDAAKIGFMQFTNINTNNQNILVIDAFHSVIARYDANNSVWNIITK